MTLEEVKEALYDITDMFFKGATVIWTEQSNTKPPLPYVTLKLGAVQRTAFPVVMDDGSRFYPCSTIVEINLYTKGKPVRVGDNITGNYINTATSDMMEFFNFVESDEVTDLLAAMGIGVTLMPPVRDLTDLQNDSKYRYRSMAEATVDYEMEANGSYGISDMAVPNSSGGGTEELATSDENTIEEIEMNGKIEGGNVENEE